MSAPIQGDLFMSRTPWFDKAKEYVGLREIVAGHRSVAVESIVADQLANHASWARSDASSSRLSAVTRST